MINTIKLFLLLLVGCMVSVPVSAQMKTVSGRILQKQFGNERPKPFEDEVRVFAFNMKSDFKSAEKAVETPGGFITNYDADTVADEDGYYSIQVAPSGYILVVVEGITHASEEVKQRLVVDFMVESGVKLSNVTVLGKAKVAVVDSMDVVDTGATIECSSILTLPDGAGKSNARCVFQPVVIDCQTGDTVEFLAPKVFDGPEYSRMQLQRMGFKMKRDKLHRYIQQEPLVTNNMRIHWAASIKKKDPKHSYTCMAALRLADFNSIYYAEDKQVSSCLARHPFQFMEYRMHVPALDKQQYKETPRGELREGAENISLSFLVGKAELDPDPKNEAELERLNDIFQQIDQNGEYQIRRIAITGYASPEGNYQSNLALAKRRANLAKTLVEKNFKHEVYIYTEEPQVIGWEVVVDSLLRNHNDEVAEQVSEILEANPKNITLQSQKIQKLEAYEEFIAPILPSLRIFKCEYAYQTVRALEPEEIMDNYLHNAEYRPGGTKTFNHYEYWHLFEMIKDPVELEGLYRRAFEESKANSTRPWVYPAHKLALSYLKRDTCDVELLRQFVDINAANVNIERTTFAGRKYMVNQEEVVAAQVASYYLAEHNDTAYYLARMLPEKEEYRQLKSFALTRGLLFRPHKTDEQRAQLAEALPVVEASSAVNRAVIQVAQRRNEEAAQTLEQLQETDPRRWYMQAILHSRAMDLNRAAQALQQCFELDATYQLRMQNDGDISDDVKEAWEFTYGL